MRAAEREGKKAKTPYTPIKSLWSDRKATFRSLHGEPDELPAPCPPPIPRWGQQAGRTEGVRVGEQEPPLLRRWLAAADAWVSSHVCPSDLINGPLRCKATPARQSASSSSACLATPHCSPPSLDTIRRSAHSFVLHFSNLFFSLSLAQPHTHRRSQTWKEVKETVWRRKKSCWSLTAEHGKTDTCVCVDLSLFKVNH